MNLSILLIAFGATTAPPPGPSAADQIEWVESLEEASEQAARDGRPVALYFTFET